MKILILLGTARPNSNSEKVALWVYTQLKNVFHHDCTLVSPHSLGLNFQSEGYQYPALGFIKMIKEAKAYIIVTPEYNHSFPGSLKFMLDIGRKEDYQYKPVAFIGVSSSNFGASRAIEALAPVVRSLGMIATNFDININNVEEFFDERESVKNYDLWQNKLKKMLDELSKYANKIK